MNTGKLKQLYFSQYALNTYHTCPLKFRRRYVDGLYWPRSWTTPAEKAGVEKGRQFHLLAQRYFNGIDSTVPRKIEFAKDLEYWLSELKRFVPPDKGNKYYPEYLLRLNRNGIKLQAKYDLITTAQDNRIIIYDWKTDTKPFQKNRLLHSMQTLVYLYLVIEAGSGIITEQQVIPEQVTMVYWNPMFSANYLEINYSTQKHKDNEQQLAALVTNILNTPYEGFRSAPAEAHCRKCEYSPICHGVRGEEAGENEEDEALSDNGFIIDIE
ncbi:PD-(D/E)XK nuclease family protein [Desulfolucanica intricata]|uniref:PD-(D/E)XK nuclease family protein n=1 Tax=Desulfolucanica intricata TaxID=1285191 RepID=UPI000830CC12|nr:PD-(D/E)XK nuclease family protein [Desulfolucanica intricata]